MYKEIIITADYMERRSGIPGLLEKNGIRLILEKMPAGDYLINDEILVERKTKEDFVLSLIQNRLFDQCYKLKRNSDFCLFVIEGNPYNTEHKIGHEAIRGALLSISVAWQIPVVFTKTPEETYEILLMAGKQMLHRKSHAFRKGYKPKRMKNRQLYFLQGMPAIGTSLAIALLEHFGSLEKVINASSEELQEIRGIGNKKAKEIREFIEAGST